MDANENSGFDPRRALEVLTDQETRATAAMAFPDHWMYGLWGAVYLLGYLPMALSFGPKAVVGLPLGLALGFFFVILAVGIIASIVISVRYGQGIRGDSARKGQLYGITWWLAFLGVMGVSIRLGQSTLPGDDIGVIINTVSMIVVATMFMAGGVIWLDVTQYVVGGAIAVVTTVAVLVGPTYYFWIECIGVGGLLLVAALFHRRLRQILPPVSGRA